MVVLTNEQKKVLSNLEPRGKFIIGMALRYMRANLDDVNDLQGWKIPPISSDEVNTIIAALNDVH